MQARVLFFAALCIFSYQAESQLIQNGAIMHVGENSVFTTSYPLSSEGFIQNSGEIILHSDWKNGGIYQGSGSLLLNGDVPQTFAHNGQLVESLRLDNPGGAVLRGNLTIRGLLELEQGLFTTAQQDTLLVEENGNIRGGSPASFVNGPLHRAGRGERVFPVGKDNIYLPAELSDVSGGNTIVSLRVESDFNGTVPPGIDRISTDYYWQLSHYRDAYSGSPVVLPLYDPQLDRTRTVILGFDAPDYSIYNDLTFQSGDYYTTASTNQAVTEAILLLGISSETIRDENVFYVPNVLSTSATDPDNRVIKVYGDIDDESFSFVVYDRRGIEVFSSTDLQRMQQSGWDGISQRTNALLPPGTYVYGVKGVSRKGEPLEKTGTLTILR